MKKAIVLMVILLSVLLAGCSGQQAEPQTLRIAVLPILDALPMHVAQAQGYFSGTGAAAFSSRSTPGRSATN